MRYYLILLFIPLLPGCKNTNNKMTERSRWPENITPPVAAKITKELTAHNDTRRDDYYWLNDRTNKEVIGYLEAENAYTNSMMEGTKDLQAKLFAEMKSRIKEKDESLPFFKNGYWYYNKFEEGYQYPVTARKKESLSANEEVLLDQNKMAEGYKYFSVGGYTVSDNNELIAYTTDPVSRRLYNLQFKNLKTGEM